MRRLQGKPPCSDLFGVKGPKWLRSLQLPIEEAETVQSALRQIAFLEREIADVERLIAKQTLHSPDARRLMTVPGVNLIATATFLAAIGDIGRFSSSRRLVAYLGLDPKVRHPASSPPARAGSPSAGRPPRGGRSSRPHGAWSASPARCATTTRASGLAADTARRLSPPRASSRCCSGACCTAARTTPTSSRR